MAIRASECPQPPQHDERMAGGPQQLPTTTHSQGLDGLLHRCLNWYDDHRRLKGHLNRREWTKVAATKDWKLWTPRDRGRRHSWGGQLSSAIAAVPYSLRLVGTITGTVDQALDALITPTTDDTKALNVAITPGVEDSALLQVLELPAPDIPRRFLAYKWLRRRSPLHGEFVTHADSVYIERVGETKLSSGERVGFHVVDTVVLPDGPSISDRRCVRTRGSHCVLFRQLTPTTVEIFGVGSVPGNGLKVDSLESLVLSESMVSLTKAVAGGEVRRLTQYLKATSGRPPRRSPPSRKTCRICDNRRRKVFQAVALKQCALCGHHICRSCRVTRFTVDFASNEGKLNKIKCCDRCMASVATGQTIEESKINTEEAIKTIGRSDEATPTAKQSEASKPESTAPKTPEVVGENKLDDDLDACLAAPDSNTAPDTEQLPILDHDDWSHSTPVASSASLDDDEFDDFGTFEGIIRWSAIDNNDAEKALDQDDVSEVGDDDATPVMDSALTVDQLEAPEPSPGQKPMPAVVRNHELAKSWLEEGPRERSPEELYACMVGLQQIAEDTFRMTVNTPVCHGQGKPFQRAQSHDGFFV